MMLFTPTSKKWIGVWQSMGTKFLPFADAATPDVPLGRLLRLALFQISAGCILVLLTGTLNRVMVIELGVPVSLVATMVAIPVLAAPFRVLIGHRSDTYRSFLGWRRVPYLWLGTLLQFGGLAIMPFALLLLQTQTVGPEWAGAAGSALAFLIMGAGLHTAQTAGLALATDLVPKEKRPRVVALLYVMLLAGMILSALVFSFLLADFSAKRLIQVIQGAAVFTLAINVISMWKQEARDPNLTRHDRPAPKFLQSLAEYRADPRTGRLLLAVALGTAAFSMQDVLLEPYGAEVLGLSVSETTLLTAFWAIGTLAGFGLAGKRLERGAHMHRVAALGILAGIGAFSAVIFAAPLQSTLLFSAGAGVIGFGGGLFAVGTMLAAMDIADSMSGKADTGFVIGAWSAVQATAIGLSLALGGILKDAANALAANGYLGEALSNSAAGYMFVYHIEIALLFISLVVLGPLVGRRVAGNEGQPRQFGLADMPG